MAQSQSHNELRPLLSSTDDLFIKKVRGKYVISSMPDKLVFGIPGTLLECQNCMDNASWRGVLIGACQECEFKYSGLLIGFDVKDSLQDRPGCSSAKTFGFFCGYAHAICNKIDKILDQYEDAPIPLEPRSIKTEDAYSFYGLASLKEDNFRLMLATPEAVAIFANRYYIKRSEHWSYHTRNDGPRYEGLRYAAIIRAISSLRAEFNPQSKDFYALCEKMEKEWMLCPDATNQEEVLLLNKEKAQKKEQHECDYCGDIKETKKCGQCQSVRYCSVACQSRDWSKGGAFACLNGDVSSPHKESCEYLTQMRLRQERYENSLPEEEKEKLEDVYQSEDEFDRE